MAYSIEYIYKILDQFTTPLQKLGKESKNAGETASNAIGGANGKLGLFKTAVGSILTAQGLIGIGQQAFEFGKDCVQAAEKSNASITLLKNNLANLGKSNAFPQLEEKADALSKTSIFNGEQILTGSTQALLRFGNIQGKTFDKAQEAALNVAAATYGVNATQEQLAQSAELVGRAMETGNVRVFARMGVTFTELEQRQMQYMRKMGDTAGLQQMVLAKISGGAGIKGAMDSLAKSPEGMRRQVTAQMEMMKVQVGNSLMPIISKFMELGLKIMPIVQMAVNALIPVITAVTGVINDLWPTIQIVINVISIAAKVIGVLSGALAAIIHFISPLIPIVLGVVAAIKIWSIVQTILDVILTMNPIGLIIIAIAALIIIIVLVITHIKQIGQFFSWLGHVIIDSVVGAFHWLMKTIMKLLDNPVIKILGLIFLPFVTIPLLIIKNWKGISAFFMGIFKDIMNNPVFKFIGNLFGGGKVTANITSSPPPPVPTPQNPPIDVNAKTSISAWIEKGIKIVPFKRSNNLGKQAA